MDPIVAHFEFTFSSYLSQLSQATSSLPPTIPSSPLLIPGSTVLPAALLNPNLSAWSDLVPLFRVLWGSAGRIESSHLTRGEEGMGCVCRLLERVGAGRLARLEGEERDTAVVWVLALRDAVRERGNQAAAAALVAEALEGVGAQVKVPSPKEEDDEVPPKPAPKPTPGGAMSWAAPPTLGSLHRSPSPQALGSPIPGPSHSHSRNLKAVERPLPPFPGVLPTPAPVIPPQNPKPKAKPRPSSNSSSRQPTPSTSANGPPKRAKKSFSPITSAAPTIDRPHRARKLTAKLVEARELVVEVQEDEHQYEVGQTVMAKFPNWSWWPAVILDPNTAPSTTQGTRTPGSYLVKSIPDGGDWHWNTSSVLRPLSSSEASSIISDTVRYPPVSWKKYRDSLLTALAIAQQDGRLEEWLGTKTWLEDRLEKEEAARKAARIW